MNQSHLPGHAAPARLPIDADRGRAAFSRRRLLASGAALALASALGRAGKGNAAPAFCDVPPREPAPFAPPDPASHWGAPPGATSTTVRRDGAGYRYEVAGQPTTIRGMGYNPTIDALSRDDRLVRLDRDLTLMASAGVNTLIGWNPAVIDGLALDVAEAAGLGVALPFDIDFTLDLTSTDGRRRLTAAILAWVERHRAHPALRMWAIGNEVLQRSVPPAWCSIAPTSHQSAWASAWGSLVVEIADAVHAADPQHPVLYREAEDAYAPWLARALEASPADRPWLIYGVNAYTPRLGAILDGWPSREIPTSLLVSEFAPLDAPRGARASLFHEIWGVIRAHQDIALGGAVYVWSTDGPEEVDRKFGLVDAGGQPVDDALDAIAELYHRDDQVAGSGAYPQTGASR